ncbi:hypothetical protein BH11ACT2_BH11ACT2_14380 [soil metagenome]
MALTRKRKKELRHLRSDADTLLHDQRVVLDQATKVIREASRQASNYAREEVAPRVRETYDDRVRPAVDSGISITRSAAHTARDKVVDDVLPSVGTALGSAIAALEAARSPEVRDAIKSASTKASKFGHEAGAHAKKLVAKTPLPVAAPKSSGPGKYILIGIAVVAVAGIAYAAWQTLRADDDLWIDDEVDQADVETPETPES